MLKVCLPADRILKCKDLISNFLKRKQAMLRKVQSLVRLLNFACAVIHPGRAFLCRLIDFQIGIRSPYHFIRLQREVQTDLQVWLDFLEEYNGKSFFLEDVWYTSERLNLYTDASGSLGFGRNFQNHWCYGSWPSSWTSFNIATLEFFSIVPRFTVSLW